MSSFFIWCPNCVYDIGPAWIDGSSHDSYLSMTIAWKRVCEGVSCKHCGEILLHSHGGTQIPPVARPSSAPLDVKRRVWWQNALTRWLPGQVKEIE